MKLEPHERAELAMWLRAALLVIILLLAGQPVWSQDIVTKDGEPVCTNWLQFLRDHPDERPIFTGYDKDGQVIKILAKQGGGTWRLVLLAAAEEARVGCAIFKGDRFVAP